MGERTISDDHLPSLPPIRLRSTTIRPSNGHTHDVPSESPRFPRPTTLQRSPVSVLVSNKIHWPGRQRYPHETKKQRMDDAPHPLWSTSRRRCRVEDLGTFTVPDIQKFGSYAGPKTRAPQKSKKK